MKSFSVLLSVYSKEKPEYLKIALESIWVNQSLKPNEIIIVKDGPLTKELESVLSDFGQNAAVKFVTNEKNLGLGASLNRGLTKCSSDFVARMDTDDISCEDRFEKQLKMLEENKNIDILGSWAVEIDERGNPGKLRKSPINHNVIAKNIWTCPMIHPTVMFRLDSLYKAGLYKEGIRRGEDYELWFRCIKAGLIFANIPEPLLKYRFTYQWFNNNNAKTIWQQVKMGWNGCRLIGAPPIAYVGSAFPLIKILLPKKLIMKLSGILMKIDAGDRN